MDGVADQAYEVQDYGRYAELRAQTAARTVDAGRDLLLANGLFIAGLGADPHLLPTMDVDWRASAALEGNALALLVPTMDVAKLADVHVHAFAAYGFGQRVVSPTDAGHCDGKHGIAPSKSCTVAALGGSALADSPTISGLLAHRATDVPPTNAVWTHQQHSPAALKEAHNEGMGLIVVSAVNNTLLCALSSGVHDDIDCSDKTNIERQIAEAWRFDEANEWFEIALTPAHARMIIARGHTAGILAIEASDYFASAHRGGVLGAFPIRPSAKRAVDDLYKMGVRSVQIAHEWDSRAAGASFHEGMLFQGGYGVIRSMVARDRRVPDKVGVATLAEAMGTVPRKPSRWPMKGEEADSLECVAGLKTTCEGGSPEPARALSYVRNQKGLTTFGARLVKRIQDQGMILDLAHVSEKAFFDAMCVLDTGKRTSQKGGECESSMPGKNQAVMLSHELPRAISERPRVELEYNPSEMMIDEIAEHNGVIGLRTIGEAVLAPSDSPVSNDCDGGVHSFAQSYWWTANRAPVAFAADMNGGATQTFPSTGRGACAAASDRRGNAEGFAEFVADRQERTTEIGMHGVRDFADVPDLVTELEADGLDVGPLRRSAEATIRMWERVGFQTSSPQSHAEKPLRDELRDQLLTNGAFSLGFPYDMRRYQVDLVVEVEGVELSIDGLDVTARKRGPTAIAEPVLYEARVNVPHTLHPADPASLEHYVRASSAAGYQQWWPVTDRTSATPEEYLHDPHASDATVRRGEYSAMELVSARGRKGDALSATSGAGGTGNIVADAGIVAAKVAAPYLADYATCMVAGGPDTRIRRARREPRR